MRARVEVLVADVRAASVRFLNRGDDYLIPDALRQNEGAHRTARRILLFSLGICLALLIGGVYGLMQAHMGLALTAFLGLIIAAGCVVLMRLSNQTTRDAFDALEAVRLETEERVQAQRQRVEQLERDNASLEKNAADIAEAAQQKQTLETSRVGALLDAMDRFAHGDLTVSLETETDQDDEVSQLCAGFTEAVAKICDILSQVNQAVESTTYATMEITASTGELANAAQHQSNQAQGASEAVEQMVHTIVDNSKNATMTAEVVNNNGRVAREGGAVVKETVQKMSEIAEVVTSSAATVEKLGESSKKIGAIVGTIREIADQTNLLALNAAIEAARAGEQGRGFAVVADEVRRLAERTMNATKEIRQMIKAIQTQTSEAVTAMQKGSKEVKDGLQLADKAGQALDEIMDGTDKTVDMINQIAAAGEEQSTNSEMISQSVEMITAISMEASQGIAMIASAADGLSQQTGQLRGLLSALTLKNPNASSNPFGAFKKNDDSASAWDSNGNSGDLWGSNDNSSDAWGSNDSSGDVWGSNDNSGDLWGDSSSSQSTSNNASNDLWGSNNAWGDSTETPKAAPANDLWADATETTQAAPANDLWADDTPAEQAAPANDLWADDAPAKSPDTPSSDRKPMNRDRGPAPSFSESIWDSQGVSED